METATELKHMVDISVGVDHHIVDFNMLNSLLHIIVSRLCSCSMNHTAIVESQDSSQTQGLSKDKSTKDEESSEAQSKPAENFSIEESFDDTRSTLQPVANKSEIADIGIRLMATELAVNNLTELMSELTRGYQNINENVAPFISGHQVSDLKDQLDDLQRDLQDKELISIRPGSINNSIKTSVNASRRPSLSSSVNLLPVPTASQSKGSINMERFTLKINSRECAAEFNKIKQEIEVIKGIIGVNDDGNLEEKTKELNLATSGSSKNYKPLTFNARMSDMEKNIKILEKCQESEKPSKASTLVDAESVSNQSSREDHGKLIGKNSEEIAFLTNQKDTAFYQIAEILHKLDKLKADKVNTDDFEEMLSEKADFKSIQKKVSIEHFNSITLDLNKKVDDFLGHMTEKETIWENSQQDLIKMIDIRLNQTDATFKDLVNQKISALHNQLREFKILHHETDAAGTKIRLLRNVNCLSCDHKAVMKTNEPVSHKLQKLAPSLSIKPFLTYELDRMRKFKDISCAKNMNYLEAAMKQCNDVESDTKYCLRFCGGSHTKVSGEERKRVLQN